jgi:hypothetical protein
MSTAGSAGFGAVDMTPLDTVCPYCRAVPSGARGQAVPDEPHQAVKPGGIHTAIPPTLGKLRTQPFRLTMPPVSGLTFWNCDHRGIVDTGQP